MTISALPVPPTRNDAANFRPRADAFLAALPAFVTEANALSADMNAVSADAISESSASANSAAASASGASVSATQAERSASLAMTLSGAQAWDSGTAYAVGAVAWSPLSKLTYRCIGTPSGADPALDPAGWALAATAAPQVAICTDAAVQLVGGQHAILANAGAVSAALPASPAIGEIVWVSPKNGRIDNVITAAGSFINEPGIDNVVIDDKYATVVLRYLGAADGWRII